MNIQLSERVKLILSECGLKQRELAELLMVPLHRIKSLATGKVQNFDQEEIKLLVDKLNLSSYWLASGDGEMFFSDLEKFSIDWQSAGGVAHGLGLPEEVEEKIGMLFYCLKKKDAPAVKLLLKDLAASGDECFVMVPRYDVRASAGTGVAIHSESIVDHLAFKHDWIAQMGLSKKDLALIEVQGDSMEPAIMHNDLILIDLRESKLSANGVYAIQHMGNLFVKRIQLRMDGSVVIKSDNPNYEPEVLLPAEAENLTVVGRVAWFGRQL